MKNVTYGIYVNTDRKYITIHYSSCGACKIANDYPNKKIQIKKCNLCFK